MDSLKDLKKCKYIIVCIGTPINNKFKPNLEKFFKCNSLKYISLDGLYNAIYNKEISKKEVYN